MKREDFVSSITRSRAINIGFDEQVGLMRFIDIIVTKDDLLFISLKYVGVPNQFSSDSWASSETYFELRGKYESPDAIIDALEHFIGEPFDDWPKTLLEIHYYKADEEVRESLKYFSIHRFSSRQLMFCAVSVDNFRKTEMLTALET